MSPKSPTASDQTSGDTNSVAAQLGNSKRAERPTSLAKRDTIVEISGNEKTKTRTTEAQSGTEAKSNMCQVQENVTKGEFGFSHLLKAEPLRCCYNIKGLSKTGSAGRVTFCPIKFIVETLESKGYVNNDLHSRRAVVQDV